MNLLSYLSYLSLQRKTSAAVAKERLQIIVARERSQRDGPDYLPMLKDELLNVIRKYVRVNQDAVKIQLEREGDYEVLELNITLLPAQTA
jgi:cell division topological specificity factor